MLSLGSTFSGIGGLEKGLEWAGLGPVVWQIENDPYCREVLVKHWPNADRSVMDVREATAANLAPVDLICGGFPCQDISSAGKGAGLAGNRSGLWREFARVVEELRPPWVVVENVHSGASRWVDAVVRDLVERGYDSLPVPLSAADVGAWHLRRRIFVVAHLGSTSTGAYAEVVQTRESEPCRSFVAHAQRDDLRQQQGRSCRENGSGSPESRCVGEAWVAANDGHQRELQQAGSITEIRGWPGNDSWWRTEPDVVRVVHGVPHGVDRRRALGNAVVPQCAEVVGWMIREMMG